MLFSAFVEGKDYKCV